MNPLIVFFFIAMMLEDFLFREGKLLKWSLYSILLYWFSHLFNKSSHFHSASRKLLLASYSQSYDPTIYSSVNFEVKNSKVFLNEFEKKTGKKITWTVFFAKCMAEILKKYPDCNQSIKFGNLHQKNTVDISVLVDIEGKVKFQLIIGLS